MVLHSRQGMQQRPLHPIFEIILRIKFRKTLHNFLKKIWNSSNRRKDTLLQRRIHPIFQIILQKTLHYFFFKKKSISQSLQIIVGFLTKNI